MKVLKRMVYEQRLRYMQLFILEKGQEDLINVYKYLMGGSKEDESSSVTLSAVPREATGIN